MRNINSVAAVLAAVFIAAAPAGAATTNYQANQSTVKFTQKSGVTSGFGNFARATSTVAYDSATGTYTIRDTGSTTIKSSFGTANIDAGASNADFTVYKKGAGETLRLLNQDPANSVIALSYVTYGQWRRSTTASGTTSVNDTYVVFGTKSPASAVTSGTGHYNTILDGTFVNKDGAYSVAGTGTFDADFGARTIAYNSTATGTPEAGGGAAINFGTMTGTGSIATASASFKGSGTTNAEGYKMDVAGNFYGPAAEEVGGVFHINGNRGNGTGAIVGN